MKITAELKKHMSISPNKSRVWVNEAGEWCNHKHPLYPIELSRDEILSTKISDAKPPVKTDEKKDTEDNGEKKDTDQATPTQPVKQKNQGKK